MVLYNIIPVVTMMWNDVFLILTLCLFVSSNQIGVLILARGGSKGVRLKNLKKVGGVSLVCRAVNVAKVAGFYDVTVSTDHYLIALETSKCDATVFHRNPITASDWAPSIWGAQEFLEQRPDIDILILIQATSPFIHPEQLRSAVKIIWQPISFDCVFSAIRSYKLRWQRQSARLIPLNFNVKDRPRRQNWNGELLETGAFYVTRKSLIDEGLFQNNNCSVVEVPFPYNLEIDSYEDLQIANAISENNLV